MAGSRVVLLWDLWKHWGEDSECVIGGTRDTMDDPCTSLAVATPAADCDRQIDWCKGEWIPARAPAVSVNWCGVYRCECRLGSEWWWSSDTRWEWFLASSRLLWSEGTGNEAEQRVLVTGNWEHSFDKFWVSFFISNSRQSKGDACLSLLPFSHWK